MTKSGESQSRQMSADTFPSEQAVKPRRWAGRIWYLYDLLLLGAWFSIGAGVLAISLWLYLARPWQSHFESLRGDLIAQAELQEEKRKESFERHKHSVEDQLAEQRIADRKEVTTQLNPLVENHKRLVEDYSRLTQDVRSLHVELNLPKPPKTEEPSDTLVLAVDAVDSQLRSLWPAFQMVLHNRELRSDYPGSRLALTLIQTNRPTPYIPLDGPPPTRETVQRSSNTAGGVSFSGKGVVDEVDRFFKEAAAGAPNARRSRLILVGGLRQMSFDGALEALPKTISVDAVLVGTSPADPRLSESLEQWRRFCQARNGVVRRVDRDLEKDLESATSDLEYYLRQMTHPLVESLRTGR